MKRSVILALTLSLIMLLTSACGSDDDNSVSFERIPEQQEEFTYSVNSNGTKIGESVMRVGPDELNGEEVIHFYSKDELGQVSQTADVYTDPSNLQPLHSQLVINNVQGAFDINGSYQDSSLVLNAMTPNGEQELTKEFNPPFYDNSQLLQTIRFLPLETDYDQVIKVINIGNASEIMCRIVVGDSETIEVEGKSYDCYYVELRFVGQRQEAWYTTDSNHVLVQYKNPNTEFQLQSGE